MIISIVAALNTNPSTPLGDIVANNKPPIISLNNRYPGIKPIFQLNLVLILPLALQ